MAVKLKGVPVMRVNIAVAGQRHLKNKKLEDVVVSAANGMWLLVMVPGAISIAIVAVVIISVSCDLISSEHDCLWCLGASETDFLSHRNIKR